MKISNHLTQVFLATFLLLAMFGSAQTVKTKPTLTVLNIDTKGIPFDPSQMGNLARIELEKLDLYDVTDRYDVAYLIDKNKLNITNCYGKMCLLEMGNIIKSDYMFTGSAELYGETIIFTFRLINLKQAGVEKTTVMEFLNLPLELQNMTGIVIRKMFDKPNDDAELARLTKKFNYENSTNNPDKDLLNLQGPRFGYSFIFGENAKILKEGTEHGGFDAYPAMFQFGYQFEKQYLNEGNYQALFEFIPMISGIDQQMFIPSIALLNGFRNTKNGWEVAIGPSFSISQYSEMGFYNGKYYTKTDLNNMGQREIETKRRLNSKGDIGIGSALVFGLGKTIKSGKMNIPINFFFTIPTHDGFRLGVSVGYNSKNSGK
ncbi:MAG: hypothetical protein K9H61_10665 [Bacteroidia bacterium]|nr:hypothetical protein [Bacteroidia bacterium]MCF8425197.1 hypothetical protein [Bacteroidia bacterium]MCF8447446.1 hypothetical protein [Bacteroidia bacterium]